MDQETSHTNFDKSEKLKEEGFSIFGKGKVSKPKSRRPKFVSDEIEAMVNKMEKMGSDLQTRLDEIEALGREKNLDLEKYFSDTYKLTKQEIELIQAHERSIINKINAFFPPESCIRPIGKSKAKLTKERKGKLRGARQNWIPMR